MLGTGALTTFLGLLVVVGWLVRQPYLIRSSPAFAPTQFNTALALAGCGVALLLLAFGQARKAAFLGGVVSVGAVLTLAQYPFDVNWGIDTAFFDPQTSTTTVHPGRVSAATAVCLFVAGFSFVLVAAVSPRGRHPLCLGLPASLIAVFALLVILGYVAGVEGAFSWGQLTRISAPAAVGLLLVATGLLSQAWADHRAAGTHSVWLPLTLATLLVGLVGLLSVTSLSGLNTARRLLGRTHELLHELEELRTQTAEVQVSARGYVLTAKSESLDSFVLATNAIFGELNVLQTMTADNTNQQASVAEMKVVSQRLIDWHRALIETRRDGGLEASLRLMDSGLGEKSMNQAHGIINRMEAAERVRLVSRNNAVSVGSRDTGVLIVAGGLLAVVLIVLAGLRVRSEMAHRGNAEREVLATSALQRAILNSSNYAIISSGSTGLVTTFNSGAERMLGYTAGEVVDRVSPALWHDRSDVTHRAELKSQESGQRIEPTFERLTALAQSNRPVESEAMFIRKDGTLFPVLESVTALHDDNGSFTGFLSVVADITARKRAEMELHQSEERFRTLVEAAPNALIMVSREGRIELLNAQAELLFGYARAELEGQLIETLVPERYRSAHPGHRESFFERPTVREMGAGRDLYGLRKDGREVPIEIGLNPLRTTQGQFVLASIIDITERKRSENTIRESLAEKEILLREIHHRVKNNMQVVSSLLNLQAGYVEDRQARAMFEDCQARVRSMAMVHEKLYRSPNLATLDFGQHVRELCEALVRTFSNEARSINLNVVADAVSLDIDTAIPVGLILNELVTNALKYAYPAGGSGELRISLRLATPEQLILSVADNGVGLPKGFEVEQARSLGLKMIRSLTRQIKGRLEVRQSDGAEFRIAFPVPLTVSQAQLKP